MSGVGGAVAETSAGDPDKKAMHLFFTVDVEAYRGDYPVEVHGLGRGLDYLLETLRTFRFRATFFVEALGGTRWGTGSLKTICRLLLNDGHEVALHLHPKVSALPGIEPRTDLLWRYPAAVQQSFFRAGLDILNSCGVAEVRVFRAGDLAADRTTLEVMRACGIALSSNRDCDTRHVAPRINHLFPVQNDVSWWRGVRDFPVSAFRSPFPLLDGPYRHLEICALGTEEMIAVLKKMEVKGYQAATLLTHPGEFFRETGMGTTFLRKNCRRLERLLAFLADQRSIRVVPMGEAGTGIAVPRVSPPEIHLPPVAAARRLVEQFAERLVSRYHSIIFQS